MGQDWEDSTINSRHKSENDGILLKSHSAICTPVSWIRIKDSQVTDGTINNQEGLVFGHHQSYEHQPTSHIVKDFRDTIKNPNTLINVLSEKAGNPCMATLQAKLLLCYGPAVSNAIEKKEIEQETAALQKLTAQQSVLFLN